ncbi:MAG TPA: hypothetical protein VHX63_12470 [Acidobacteriaceae bacterium]|jgi:hypothetical protein|nr:hypothetical protein [Acidobacteriaceae bacterium]
MEFIRHSGDLQCSKCSRVETNRNIYYAFADEKQVYWFVCGAKQCGEWTRLTFGYEELGQLAPSLRRRNEKIRRFEESNEVEKYGTNWS